MICFVDDPSARFQQALNMGSIPVGVFVRVFTYQHEKPVTVCISGVLEEWKDQVLLTTEKGPAPME